ncbi:uncharacterized protein STEHIDRAFT_46745 [Stereum hirsutum FP-91666 SS1]|uniref:uncharacterized protein n=1 Tax=Stereum hirsutum (strain FP-91666) TaxID=721885 RepID=UPI000440EA72|nr:uncharacterized protein STEHIDRAFT_46745 [Stereum hirsutum FP-91666 SS1]EIM92552.1 hypothetical protein STEHIDRAFT_46745 [Stereum hirsutum FP-91666 SS1]
MPASEIDDIFSSKGKAKVPQPVASSSTAPPKKKKKDKKRKREVDPPSDDPKPSKPKRAIPETIVDPSAQLAVSAPPAKRPKKAKSTEAVKAAGKESEARFKDSRGTGPRRTTEEGFSIYKEDELGIKDEGGGVFSPFLLLSRYSPTHLQIHHCAHLTVNVVSASPFAARFTLTYDPFPGF